VGLENTDQVVVYDRQGANYCGRLWWMLKWLGHANVAVLDGGFQAWAGRGRRCQQRLMSLRAHRLPSRWPPALVALRSSDQVLAHLGKPTQHGAGLREAPALPR